MLVIDRFEGEYAIIEMNRRLFHIPKSLFPKGSKEGDVINIQIIVDKDETMKRKQAIGKIIGKYHADFTNIKSNGKF